MISSVMYETLTQFVPKENILQDKLLKNYTTFGIGGKANCIIEIQNKEQIADIVKYLTIVEYPYMVIGRGSNLLVSDRGYDGIILHIEKMFSEISVEGNTIIAQPGALMSRLAYTAMEKNWQGAEFAFGIPGTVGGGVVMNAGAYGGEMSQIVKNVTVISPKGEILLLDNSTMEFGYRTSIAKQYDYIIAEVCIECIEGNGEEIKKKMLDFSHQRKEKQPLENKSAGSTFKRPQGHFAGKLIMEAGLSGISIGDAEVSTKHCGFIINKGNARAKDIAELIQVVAERVYNHSGVRLEEEIIYVGSFDHKLG